MFNPKENQSQELNRAALIIEALALADRSTQDVLDESGNPMAVLPNEAVTITGDQRELLIAALVNILAD